MSIETFLEMVANLVKNGNRDTPSIFLESQLTDHPSGRYSIFAADPAVTLKAWGDRIFLTVNGKTVSRKQNPWDALKKTREDYPGWYLGYLGYDLKNYTEDLTSSSPDPVEAPDLLFFCPRTLLVYHHPTGHLTTVSGYSLSSPGEEFPAAVLSGSDSDLPDSGSGIPLEGIHSLTGRSHYLDKIRTAAEMIREGEFYEINLSHLLQGTFRGDGFELYQQMKKIGPVPFAAWLRWDDYTVCSASPERFLCRNGRRVYSQPIKGTAPKMDNPQEDERKKAELLSSEKELAENLMIVDLVRHDLSRVSVPGSVRVPELFTLQSFETVHQLISTIEGEVDQKKDPVEILKACFPMGSMTGAPKIRAMHAIENLEDYKRGIYSGAIGYIRPSGEFDFNVVIRTAILKGDQLFYPVGGAITSDSVPADEWLETCIKARALTNVNSRKELPDL